MIFSGLLSRSIRASLFFVIMGLLACRTNKNITYFKDIPDSLYGGSKEISTIAFSDPKIQPNDILQVAILTLDPTVNAVLSNENSTSYAVQPGSSSSSTPAQPLSGFLVDRNGDIELPLIGKIKLSGLTTSEARDIVHEKVSQFYKSPVVNVRFANLSITILGEVAKPATYIVPNEKVTVLDAIGMAGDLTIFGKRENVLLVRDSIGKKVFYRFSLNSTDFMKSRYFYLQQGDVLYVEPSKSRIASTDAIRTRNYALLASALTIIITIITRFK